MIDEKVKQKGREVSALKIGIRALNSGHPDAHFYACEALKTALNRAERIGGRGLEEA